MNKRQKKKQEYPVLPKNIKRLVRKYSSLHFKQDYEGGVFSYSYNEDTKELKLIHTLTKKTASLILSDCETLFAFCRFLIKDPVVEYSCGEYTRKEKYRWQNQKNKKFTR